MQAAQAKAVKVQVAAQLRKLIATSILPAQTFWPAEGYHQDYALKNPASYGWPTPWAAWGSKAAAWRPCTRSGGTSARRQSAFIRNLEGYRPKLDAKP